MNELLAARSEHIATAPAGRAAASGLCELTDEVVRHLARAASSSVSGRWALVALGGWGAGALLPKSDLDILVLSDADERELKAFVTAILYPLWDAGLAVGHQVRTPKQQIKAMREDVKTATAALTARPLAGDTDWAAAAIDTWLGDTRKRSRRLLSAIAERPRPGSPYRLEPDLKEDRGGRRDYDELTWIAAILYGSRQGDPRALVELGLLSADEFDAVHSAADHLTRARWHLQRDGFGNTMSLEAAQPLADFAETVQAALGTTALTLEHVRRRVGGAKGTAATDLDADGVFALLDQGEIALEALEEAAQAGRLDSLVPGMHALMSCRRPGLGHELTVGAHQLRAATLVVSATGADGAMTRSLQTLSATELRVAQVAALVHDTGKTEGGAGHAQRGAIPAHAAARRFGFDETRARDVSDIVRLHLLLAETALRDDLDDEDTILRCASAIERRELLAPLHLVTAADARATGPSTWTPWTAALIATLVARLDAALSPESDGAGLATRGEAVRAATLSAMNQDSEAEQEFVRSAPLRYLASREPMKIARDARLVADLAREPSVAVQIAVSSGPVPDTHAITIVTGNGRAVLAHLAGAVSLAGLQILSVDAFEGPDGSVLDYFVVASATQRPASTETFSRLERLVGAALRDRLELRTRLDERRRHYPPQGRGASSVHIVPTGWATALRVTAPDRPGLLHDIAQAVADSELSISWAKAITVDGMARDVFHVVAEDGSPATDPGMLGHVVMRVRSSL